MSSSPKPTDQSLADLFELGAAIDELILASVSGDKELTQKAYDEVLQSVSCAAIFHCDIVANTIRDYKRNWKRLGLRQITLPADYEGLYVVTPEKSKL